MSDHKAASRVIGDYGDILKTENCMKRRAKLEKLKTYARSLEGEARQRMVDTFPELYRETDTTSKN